MIDENLLEKIIPIQDEEEEMEDVEAELTEQGFSITSFKKGGVFYHIIRLLVSLTIELKELARTILNSCFILHAEGDWLDIKGADFSKKRKEAKKTKGYVTVYRAEYEQPAQVTRGHCFKTIPDEKGNELKYYVLADTVLEAGKSSCKVLVEAEDVGTHYNIAPERITVSTIHIEGIERVSNEEGWLFEEGTEKETDEEFRRRCMSSWSELSTRTIAEKLKNAAKSVAGVLDARIDDQHPRGQGTVDIIVTSSAGQASDELIRQVTEVIMPLKGQYEDYLVKSSEIVKQDIDITIYLSQYASTDGVRERAEKIIEEAMRLPREEMNCLYRDDLIRRLGSIENYRKTVFKTPTFDIENEENKVIMAGEITVEVKNVRGG